MCWTLGLAAVAAVMPHLAAALATPELYSCDVEYDMWETAWTPPWKEWCCEHHDRGCPATSTQTATSSTSTAAPTVTTSAAKSTNSTSTAPPNTTMMSSGDGELACGKICSFEDMDASCSDRIKWGKSHEMANVSSPCAESFKMVIDFCPICGECPLKYSGCDTPEDEDVAEMIMKQAELPRVLSGTWSGPQLLLGVMLSGIGAAGLTVLTARRITNQFRSRRSIHTNAMESLVAGRANEWATPMKADDSSSEDAEV